MIIVRICTHSSSGHRIKLGRYMCDYPRLLYFVYINIFPYTLTPNIEVNHKVTYSLDFLKFPIVKGNL